jgi:hypothetical protein
MRCLCRKWTSVLKEKAMKIWGTLLFTMLLFTAKACNLEKHFVFYVLEKFK